MCTPGSLCCNTLSSHSNPGMCHCALLKLNFSFYTQFSMADPLLGPNHGTALGRTRHPQVAVVLTRVMQGTRQPTRVLWLHPPFPSRKVNCAKQKNRLEIEPGNKEGLISFVSVLAFFFFLQFALFFSLLECRRGMPPSLRRGFILEQTV